MVAPHATDSREKRILCIGPMPPPMHGQAFVFAETYKILGMYRRYLVNVNVSGKSLPRTLCIAAVGVVKTLMYWLTKKISIVYFTCSRSLRGSLVDIIVILLSRMAGVTLVNHIHGSDFRRFYDDCPGVYRRIIELVYQKIDVSIVPMKGMDAQISSLFPRMDVTIIHNFISDDVRHVGRKPRSETIRILFLSNIMKSKGIMELLDAFSILSREKHAVSLTIAGEIMGDRWWNKERMEREFFRRIEELRLSSNGNINYRGFVTGKEKAHLLCESDILVLPSYNEALPLAIIEAMHAGNAIIATKTLYLDHYISDNEGVLVPIGDVHALVQAIRYLTANESTLREIQNHNKNITGDRFSFARYRNDIILFFESLEGNSVAESNSRSGLS